MDKLISQNNLIHEEVNIVVNYIKTNTFNNRTNYTAFVEVDPFSFSLKMKNKKVYIGWKVCKVFEDLNIHT